jgi:hypothetical protein
MPVTINGTAGITFNDATTQGTAAGAPSSISAIGSVVIVANASTSNLIPGNTIAGSSLLYQSTITEFPGSSGVSNSQYFSEGSSSSSTATRFWYEMWSAYRNNPGNSGFVLGGTTAMSGTWRLLTPASARYYIYEGDYNSAFSAAKLALAIRIA